LLPPHRLSPGGSGDGIGRSQRPLEPPMHVDHVLGLPWVSSTDRWFQELDCASDGRTERLSAWTCHAAATGAAAASGSATARPSTAAARWLISSSIRVRLRSS